MKPSGANRRKLSNIKLTKKFHFKYLGWWILISLVYVALLDLAVFFLYQQMWAAYTPIGADPIAERMFRYSNVAFSLSVLTIFFLLAVTILAMTTAHRIAGPYIALERTFDQVRDGDLHARLHFRTEDGLDHVESAFNELMEDLQGKLEGEST